MTVSTDRTNIKPTSLAGAGMRSALMSLALAHLTAGPVYALSPARVAAKVPLIDVTTLAKPYPNLLLQIRLELLRANLSRDKVTCTGDQMDGTWHQMKTAVIGPYQCKIGRRTLVVTTTPVFYDAKGYRLSPTAADVALKATRVQETKLKWTWR
jgi:hypothetical protein